MSQLSFVLADIPGVFQKAPRDFVPKDVTSIVDQEVDRINVRISGFRAWYRTTGAAYKAEYFVAMTSMLQKYAGLVEAKIFARHAEHELARIHKDIQFSDQYKDADQRHALLAKLERVEAARAGVDFTYQELQAGHELRMAETLTDIQGQQVNQAVNHEAWKEKIPADLYVEEQKKRRMDKAQLDFLEREAELQIKKRVRADNAHLFTLKELVKELSEAKAEIRKITQSSLPEAVKRDEISGWNLLVTRLERELTGRKDTR